MSVYNYLRGNKALESIIMTLYDQIFNLAIHGTLSRTLACIWIDKVVVPVNHCHRCFCIFGKDDLVIMAVDGDTCDVVVFFDIKRDVMVVDDQLLTLPRLLLLLLLSSTTSLSVLVRRRYVLVWSHPAFTLSLETSVSLALHLLLLVAKLLCHTQTLICELADIHQVLQLWHSLHVLIHEILLLLVRSLTWELLMSSVTSSLRMLHWWIESVFVEI